MNKSRARGRKQGGGDDRPQGAEQEPRASSNPRKPKAASGEGKPKGNFNAPEAVEFLKGRYAAVEKALKEQGSKSGPIVQYQAEGRNAWGQGNKPMIPPKDDFVQQLQVALQPFLRSNQNQSAS